MWIRSMESIAYDPEGKGKLLTIAPNRPIRVPDNIGEGFLRAYPETVFEIDDPGFETATASPQRKRKN